MRKLLKDSARKAMFAKKGQGISSKFLEDEHNKSMKGRMTSFGNPNPPNKFENNWNKHTLHAIEGDGEAVIYTSKNDPTLTVEMHPLDEYDNEDETGTHYNSWYIFPAKNGKGIPNSPDVISGSGGYTKSDANKRLIEILKETDDEISN
jgi:hypothetical protein